jgi:hypothetical protein
MTSAETSMTRRVLFDALATIAPNALHRTRWRLGDGVWQTVQRDPTMRCDWSDPARGDRARKLLALPVDLDDDNPACCELVVAVDTRHLIV